MSKLHVIVNWWLRPTFVARLCKVRLERHADWQVLARFGWGELAYDYEEGLKFSVNATEQDLRACVAYVRAFHVEHGVVSSEELVEAQLNAMGRNIPTLDDVFTACGFVRSKDFDFVWKLPPDPLNAN